MFAAAPLCSDTFSGFMRHLSMTDKLESKEFHVTAVSKFKEISVQSLRQLMVRPFNY